MRPTVKKGDKGADVQDAATASSTDSYERYHPLWHLFRTNVIEVERDDKGQATAVSWLLGEVGLVPDEPPTRVALIDNGACLDHPYLKESVDQDLAIDFASQPFGLAYDPRGPADCSDLSLQGCRTSLPERIPDGIGLEQPQATAVQAVLDRARLHRLKRPDRATFHKAFAGHATACAGLVAAKPAKPPKGPQHPVALYVGVDPYCKVVPINTSIIPDPEQLILAFLYAYHIGSDVILVPRGISTHWRKYKKYPDGRNRDYRNYDNPSETLNRSVRAIEWEALESLILEISEQIPVVTAAGNSAESSLAYPAKLSAQEGGVISVGAVTHRGYRSGYSNYSRELTLVCPSDDSEVFNRHQVRLDKKSRRYLYHDYSSYAATDASETERHPEYSHQSILALDVPGRPGYAGGGLTGTDEDDPVQDWFDPTRGAFALFGGTSAASSILAGIVSLMKRKAAQLNKELSGRDVKQILQRSCHYDDLHIDDINGEFNSRTSKEDLLEQLFGAGLVDARKALNHVETW